MIQRHRKNKRGMLGNLIGAFVMVFIGFTLYGTISQVVDNSLNCVNGTNVTIQPNGQTDSFGGGGSGSFGGYDGQVHKSWGSRINVISVGNMTLGCLGEDVEPYSRVLLQLMPTFFLIAVIFAAFMMFYSSFHNIYWGDDDI